MERLLVRPFLALFQGDGSAEFVYTHVSGTKRSTGADRGFSAISFAVLDLLDPVL